MKSSLWPRTLLPLAIFLVALLMRVVPAWDAAYGDGYPNLQGGDSYYHLRSVEALIANFPKRPEFDPYAIYPGGMAVLTGPFLDYLIAILALVLGMGSPSPELVRHVAAWVPPLFGAVTVFPLFWLGLRLFGTAGAAAGAFFFAVCPGHTVFYAKLGSADHHVFEALFYAWVLAALAAALDPLQSSRGLYAIAAGVAVGFALLNRPAAAFLSPVFGIWAGLQAGLAPEGARANRSAVWATVGALLLGWLFLFPGGAGAWGVLPHALMAAGIVAALVGWLSAEWAQARGIPRWAWAAALVGVVVVAGALLWFAGPRFLIERVRSALDALLGLGSTLVAEARPTVRDGFKPLLKEVGPLGLLAPPLWAAMAWIALRTKSRPLSLVSGTGLAMYAGTLA
ncbi:MAG: glycosyltransferase family 39 protein, partial [Acidobacteria bacterium]|nr:glycosyltransferase family 39 protein [Acidobacteriota bacterium]